MFNPRLFLLVLVLTGVLCSPVKGGTLCHVNNIQNVYQAEEHSNVTLTLSAVNTTSDVVSIELRNERNNCIYRYLSKRKPHVDGEFKGRLQCDPHLHGNGWIKCVLTDLRMNDTGSYEGIVKVRGKAGERRCNTEWQLKVVKASIHPTQEAALKHQTPEETPEPPPRERLWILIPLSLFLLAVLLLVFLANRKITYRDIFKVPPLVQK